jgi:ADP-heptose:LPS heptosyltransferase
LAALRRDRPDVALILHGNEPQATPLAYLAGSCFIFKLPNVNRFAFLLANSLPRLAWADFAGHAIKQRLAVAALAGARVADRRTQLPVPKATPARVGAWLAQGGIAVTDTLIGLQAGASSRGRMWPVEHFTALARLLLVSHPGCRFVIFGGPQERTRCAAIAEHIGVPAVVAAGAIAIEMLPALIQRCAVLVTGDTGTLHMAVALGTPTVSLFAVSDPAVSGPAHDPERHSVIFRQAPVGVRSKTDDEFWMAQIAAEEVCLAVMRQLESREQLPNG